MRAFRRQRCHHNPIRRFIRHLNPIEITSQVTDMLRTFHHTPHDILQLGQRMHRLLQLQCICHTKHHLNQVRTKRIPHLCCFCCCCVLSLPACHAYIEHTSRIRLIIHSQHHHAQHHQLNACRANQLHSHTRQFTQKQQLLLNVVNTRANLDTVGKLLFQCTQTLSFMLDIMRQFWTTLFCALRGLQIFLTPCACRDKLTIIFKDLRMQFL
mmetsp:Transcript_52394/g.86726  ORF Transcript_52394/g.86726 Transcript_52394/m.86726 type:complete len:211 (-) Transcript_52394:10-642(-)